LKFAVSAVPAGTPAATQQQQQLQGKDVVIAFYDAYNKRDLAAIQDLIADDISYHDLVYDEPHEGREGVMSWLKKVSLKMLENTCRQADSNLCALSVSAWCLMREGGRDVLAEQGEAIGLAAGPYVTHRVSSSSSSTWKKLKCTQQCDCSICLMLGGLLALS
jgi:hypothetical protein